MFAKNKITLTVTRAEARLIEEAICEEMDWIRWEIKKGQPAINSLERFAACRAILRKLDGWGD